CRSAGMHRNHATPQPDANLERVKDIVHSHINNEYYTQKRRASEAYFREIEDRRYRFHYHLRALFSALKGSHGKLLEVGCGIGVDRIQLATCGLAVIAVY